VARLTSDFFVSAYIRRCHLEGAFAGLRRRGGHEAGAIFIIIDHLDGTGTLYGPASQSAYKHDGMGERAFTKLHKADTLERPEIEKRIEKEIVFDPDCWIVEVETRTAQHFLEHIV
jgi:hypothetical protein